MRRLTLLPALILIITTLTNPVLSVEPDEILSDPTLEVRARAISKDLRCLVCQNESIDDSNADLARDLRILVRERLTKGETNEQVIAFVVARYGDFVLLRPPFKSSTALLWGGPAILLLFGIFATGLWFRRRTRASETTALSAEEEARLAEILGDPNK